MPTLSAVPLSSLPTAADPGRTVVSVTQAARHAASDAFRAASIQVVPGRCAPARAVRTLDLRVEEARECFETMLAGLPVARVARDGPHPGHRRLDPAQAVLNHPTHDSFLLGGIPCLP